MDWKEKFKKLFQKNKKDKNTSSCCDFEIIAEDEEEKEDNDSKTKTEN